jgi:Transmembrane domain of unknown function (DUF3566)
MSPPDESPAASTTAKPKPPPRKRAGGDGDGAKAADDSTAVKSAAGAPAPPRRSKRGDGPSSTVNESTAALQPPEPAGAATPAPPPAAKEAPKPAAKATPKPAPAAAPVEAKPDAPAADAAVPDVAAKPSRFPRVPRPSLPRRPPKAGDDSPATATSDRDAEAVLVDDTTTTPPPRRFGRGAGKSARTVSASVPTAVVTPSASVAAPVTTPPVAPAPLSGRTTVVRGDRQYRQTVTKVDLWSVTKLSLCFYLSAMFVTVVALVSLWLIASAAGIISSIEKFLGDLLSAKNFHFLSATVLRGAILVGLVIVALQVVITVISASFYNIFAELFGGVEITVREEGPADYPDPSLGL